MHSLLIAAIRVRSSKNPIDRQSVLYVKWYGRHLLGHVGIPWILTPPDLLPNKLPHRADTVPMRYIYISCRTWLSLYNKYSLH